MRITNTEMILALDHTKGYLPKTWPVWFSDLLPMVKTLAVSRAPQSKLKDLERPASLSVHKGLSRRCVAIKAAT